MREEELSRHANPTGKTPATEITPHPTAETTSSAGKALQPHSLQPDSASNGDSRADGDNNDGSAGADVGHAHGLSTDGSSDSSGSKSNLTDEEKAKFKADSERRKLDSASSDRG